MMNFQPAPEAGIPPHRCAHENSLSGVEAAPQERLPELKPACHDDARSISQGKLKDPPPPPATIADSTGQHAGLKHLKKARLQVPDRHKPAAILVSPGQQEESIL